MMNIWQILLHKKLSTKVVSALVAFLSLAIISIGLTLYWAWQLQGSAAVINEAGRLRMYSYRVAVLQQHLRGMAAGTQEEQAVQQQMKVELNAMQEVFRLLQQGDPQRPLFLPPSDGITEQLRQLQLTWQLQFGPLTDPRFSAQTPLDVDGFVGKVNLFVKKVEQDSERRNFWLRISQLTLLFLAVLSTMILIYILFVIIIQPVERLQVAMQAMQNKDLSVRVPVEGEDEFGELSTGFNQMAQELQALYTQLEERVKEKTATLSKQNRELALLYDCAAFLQMPQSVEALCEGFLERIQTFFNAQAGSVRVLNDGQDQLYTAAKKNLPDSISHVAHCVNVQDCVCAQAVYQKSAVVHQLEMVSSAHLLACQQHGFKTVAAFHIHVHQEYLGLFNLYFMQQRLFMPHEKTMLDALGQLVGVAIKNIRLATQARELARLEERNLVAQGLHDSIAQGLTFLNLQMQLLEDSLSQSRMDQVEDVIPALQAGIQEIYDDVRELLLNFRSRLSDGGLYQAIAAVVDKFQQQTGIEVQLETSGSGNRLSREQQLQILFIVQEALSNVRKHADATQVNIVMSDERDFDLKITDDGEGFEMSQLQNQDGSHIGLHIMRERSNNILAQLHISSDLGQGTCIHLHLPEENRHAA